MKAYFSPSVNWLNSYWLDWCYTSSCPLPRPVKSYSVSKVRDGSPKCPIHLTTDANMKYLRKASLAVATERFSHLYHPLAYIRALFPFWY